MDLVVGVKHTLLTIELMSKLASKLPSLAVANAIKVLTSLVASSVVKFIMLMLYTQSISYYKVKTSITIWTLTILVATYDFQSSPVFTSL